MSGGGDLTSMPFGVPQHLSSRSSQGSSLAQASHMTGLLATPPGGPMSGPVSTNPTSPGPMSSGGGLLATPLSPTMPLSPPISMSSKWANFGADPAPAPAPSQEFSGPGPGSASALQHDVRLPQAWAAVGRERDSRRRSGVMALDMNADDSLFEARRLSLGGDGNGDGNGDGHGSNNSAAPSSGRGSPVIQFKRRSSLAGIHAEQAASEPRLSTETIADLTSALGAGSRRLSLSEKIQKIKADNVTNNASPLQSQAHSQTHSPTGRGSGSPHINQRSGSPHIVQRSGSPRTGQLGASPAESSSMLLGPSFFKAAGPSKSPPGLRRGSVPANLIQNIIRMPLGPDGTRGFGNRRASMVK